MAKFVRTGIVWIFVILSMGVPLQAMSEVYHSPFGPLGTINTSPLALNFYQFPTDHPFTTPKGRFQIKTILNYSNVFEGYGQQERGDPFRLLMDTEIFNHRVWISYGVTDRIEIGIELPWGFYHGGFLDWVIYHFHHAFSLPQVGRQRVAFGQNRYSMTEFDTESPFFEANSFDAGLMDIALLAKAQLLRSPFDFAVRGALKLPTGSRRKGLGSGGVDAGIGVIGQKQWAWYTISGTLSLLLLYPTGHLRRMADTNLKVAVSNSHTARLASWIAFVFEHHFQTSPYRSNYPIPQFRWPSYYGAFGFSFRPAENQVLKLIFMEDFLPYSFVDVNFGVRYEITL